MIVCLYGIHAIPVWAQAAIVPLPQNARTESRSANLKRRIEENSNISDDLAHVIAAHTSFLLCGDVVSLARHSIGLILEHHQRVQAVSLSYRP